MLKRIIDYSSISEGLLRNKNLKAKTSDRMFEKPLTRRLNDEDLRIEAEASWKKNLAG